MGNSALENASVKERQNKDRQALIEILKEMPIITVACKKAGVDSSTYYRWRKEDKEFMQRSENALDQGKEFLNDMAQSQTVSLMKDKYWPTIKYYLDHRHPDYMKKIPASGENEPSTATKLIEERNADDAKWEAMAHEFGERIKKEDI